VFDAREAFRQDRDEAVRETAAAIKANPKLVKGEIGFIKGLFAPAWLTLLITLLPVIAQLLLSFFNRAAARRQRNDPEFNSAVYIVAADAVGIGDLRELGVKPGA
jgi:hypothetical protein